MKKTYEKPRICYESFALSDRISSGCVGISNLAEYQCAIWLPDAEISIFMIELVCEFPPTDGDTICYHAPEEGNNVYSS